MQSLDLLLGDLDLGLLSRPDLSVLEIGRVGSDAARGSWLLVGFKGPVDARNVGEDFNSLTKCLALTYVNKVA